MAGETPQLENGYVRIANELYEAILKHPFSKRELLIVLAVIRKTYGYGKKSDDMTMTQLAEITGMQRTHVGETVSALYARSVLLIRDGYHGKVIGLSKNYKKWKSRPKSGRCTKSGRTPSQNSTHPVPNRDADVTKTGHTKDNPKRQIQKTNTKDSYGGAKAPTVDTWNSYSAAYFQRYGVEPVRNAKVNGQLSKFLQRIPKDEAPEVAAYFLHHNNSYYIRCGHSVDCLLKDAEKLRTEWVTNSQITQTHANQTDKTQANFSVFDKLKGEANAN